MFVRGSHFVATREPSLDVAHAHPPRLAPCHNCGLYVPVPVVRPRPWHLSFYPLTEGTEYVDSTQRSLFTICFGRVRVPIVFGDSNARDFIMMTTLTGAYRRGRLWSRPPPPIPGPFRDSVDGFWASAVAAPSGGSGGFRGRFLRQIIGL
jgi:hypothetical protein